YQLRISRTRSFIPIPPYRDLNVRSGASAASAAAVGSAAVLAFDPRGVAHALELRLGHPAEQVGVELGLAVHAVSSLLAVLVERHADEPLLLAARAMPQRELAVKERIAHAPPSAATPRPRALSSASM